MPYVVNITPFEAQAIEQRFYNGHLYDCLFVKATFKLTASGQLKPLAQQPDFVITDEYEPPEQSNFEQHRALRYPSDLTPYKPATDVLVIGHARPAGNLPQQRWIARLLIEGKLDKLIQITGPRAWQHTFLGGWRLQKIEETNAVRLSYALAAGGGTQGQRESEDDLYIPNPFGRGYLGRDKADEAQSYPAPQILQATELDPVWNKPAQPAGLSPMAGLQWDRLKHAGTYDEHWRKHVAPNIPLDMDMAFWNAAPADQTVKPYLQGGERIYTQGLFPTQDGWRDFALPRYEVFAVPLKNGQKEAAFNLHLDTVILDLDAAHVTMRWCTLISQERGYDQYQVLAYEQSATTTGQGVQE